MPPRVRLFYMLSGLAIATALVVFFTVYELFDRSFHEQSRRLTEIASSQASLIRAVQSFDAQYSRGDHPGGARAATLSQVIAALSEFEGIGKTGELVLAEARGDSIHFFMRSRKLPDGSPKPVPLADSRAEPMRLALSGERGVILAPDYLGESVLAAYEPIPELQVGLVAKIDVAEFRSAYLFTGLSRGMLLVVLIVVGGVLLARIGGALRESEEVYRITAQVSPVGIYRTDADGACTYVNERWCEIARMSPQEAMGQGWSQALFPEDRERIFAEWTKAAKERTQFKLEYRFGNTEEDAVWVLGQAEAMVDSSDRVTGYVGTITDLSEIRRLQEILPICSHCKKIRDDENYWSNVEEYISEHTATVFSHGVCPQCYSEHYAQYEKRAASTQS